MARHVSSFWCLLLTFLLAGCAEEWGPTQKVVVDVRGRVRVGVQPVRGGWVEFIPLDGAVGDVRSAPIQPDGGFHATKVARGRNVIRIVYPPPYPDVHPVFRKFFSPIRPFVDGETFLGLDLLREGRRPRDESSTADINPG